MLKKERVKNKISQMLTQTLCIPQKTWVYYLRVFELKYPCAVSLQILGMGFAQIQIQLI